VRALLVALRSLPRGRRAVACGITALALALTAPAAQGQGISVFIGTATIPGQGVNGTVTVPAAALGTVTSLTHASSGGSSGGFTTANLWVDTNGGTCTRQSSPGAYNDAQACDTFDEAYDVSRAATGASCGDRVLVKAGTYSGQNLSGYRNSCSISDSTQTLFAPESFDCDLETVPTSTPVTLTGSVGNVDTGGGGTLTNGMGHVTFCGFTLAVSNVDNTQSTGTVTNNSRWGIGADFSRAVWFKRMIAGGFGFFDSGFDRGNTGAGDMRVLFSDIRDCHGAHDFSNYVCSNGKIQYVEDALIRGNLIRNFRSLSNCTAAIECGHWEPVYLVGTAGVTIQRNRFFNYEQSAGIYTTCFQDTEGSGLNDAVLDNWVHNCHRDLLIENNWSESPHNTDAGGQDPEDGGERGENAISVGGHCEGYGGVDYNNVVVRNNTVVGALGEIAFDGATGSGCNVGSGGVTVVGNIANKITNTAGCSQTNVTIDRNIGTIYSSGGNNSCGANRHNATLATSILTNSTWGSLSQDAHLSSSSTVASGFVPEASCPDEDFDGDARPAGACDAGMDER
jgi:hypothetical protein